MSDNEFDIYDTVEEPSTLGNGLEEEDETYYYPEETPDFEHGYTPTGEESSYLSNKVAIEIIEQQMQETEQAIEKLEDMIKNNPETSNKV